MKNYLPRLISGVLLMLVWIMFSSVSTVAQDISKAKQYSKKARELYLASDWDSAAVYYLKSAKAYESLGETSESIGQAISLVDLMIAKNELESVKSAIDSLFALIPEDDNIYNDVKSQLYWKLGTYNEMISSLDEAYKYTEKAIAIQEKINQSDPTILSDMYIDLGLLYQRDKDYLQALRHYQKSLRLRGADGDPLALANIHNSLAVAQFYLGKYRTALQEYQSCLSYYRILNPNHPKVAVTYNNMAFVYMQTQNYDSSIWCHRKALNIRLNTLPENHPQTVSSYNGIGMVYTVNKQYDSAELYFNKCIQLLESHNSESFNYFLSRMTYNLCQLNYRREEFYESLRYIDEAINLNLPAKQLSDSTFSEIKNIADLVDLMQFKVKIVTRLYQKYGNPNDLDVGLMAFSDLQRISNFYLNNIRFIDSQLQVIQILEQAYPLGIMFSYEKYSKAGTPSAKRQLAESLFYNIEFYKSNLLRRNVFRNNQLNISRLNDNLLNEEKELREVLASLKSKSEVNEEALFENERQYAKILKRIEEEDPQYFELKFKSFVPTLNEAIAFSKVDKKVIFEYFLSPEALYGIFIDQEDVEINKIEIDSSFQADLQAFYTGLSSYDSAQITNTSKRLYKRLMAPYADRIARRDVVIVADGMLNQIPFGLLSDSNDKFLLDEVNLSYANSMSLLLNFKKRQTKSAPRVLALAPTYNVSSDVEELLRSDKLTHLNWTTEEIRVIGKFFNVDNISGAEATEQVFRDNIGKYDVIHFAGHGILDIEDPMRSRLAFSLQPRDSSNSVYLFTQELLGMSVSVDMVVLSACKTGLGKFINGEGAMSLARGFFYAGTRSVVMSYWQVDDQSTSQLMQFFYKNLKAGMAKSEALRQAKLEFIETAPPEKQHPFYWGAFVVIGDDSPIYRRSYVAVAMPGVMLLFLILLWLTGHLRKKSI